MPVREQPLESAGVVDGHSRSGRRGGSQARSEVVDDDSRHEGEVRREHDQGVGADRAHGRGQRGHRSTTGRVLAHREPRSRGLHGSGPRPRSAGHAPRRRARPRAVSGRRPRWSCRGRRAGWRARPRAPPRRTVRSGPRRESAYRSRRRGTGCRSRVVGPRGSAIRDAGAACRHIRVSRLGTSDRQSQRECSEGSGRPLHAVRGVAGEVEDRCDQVGVEATEVALGHTGSSCRDPSDRSNGRSMVRPRVASFPVREPDTGRDARPPGGRSRWRSLG